MRVRALSLAARDGAEMPAIFTFPTRIIFGEGSRTVLADELARREEQALGERSEIESRVAELSERLVEALGR